MIDNEDKPNFLINRQEIDDVVDEISDDIGGEIGEISGEIPCDTCPWRDVLHEKFIPPVECVMPPIVEDGDSPVHTQPDDPESAPMDTPDDPEMEYNPVYRCGECVNLFTDQCKVCRPGEDEDSPVHTQPGDPEMENARLKVFSFQVGGSHYKTEGIPDGFPDPAEFCIQHNLGGAETNVIKYVFRHPKKNGLEDLRKAKQWLDFLAAVRYNATL